MKNGIYENEFDLHERCTWNHFHKNGFTQTGSHCEAKGNSGNKTIAGFVCILLRVCPETCDICFMVGLVLSSLLRVLHVFPYAPNFLHVTPYPVTSGNPKIF